MNSAVLFLSAAVLIAAVLSVFFGLTAGRSQSLQSMFHALPRNKAAGAVLSALVISWCVPNIRPIAGPVEWIQDILIPAAVIAIIAVSVFLDYLFARAFAGFLILAAHAMLKEIFPLSLPGYPLYAFLLMSMGIIGIVISAKPHYFRLWIEKSEKSAGYRIASVLFFGIIALISLIYIFMLPAAQGGSVL